VTAPAEPIPEHLPHEPVRRRAGAVLFSLQLCFLWLLLWAYASVAVGLLPWFVLGTLLWGWPPHLTHAEHAWRHFKRAFTAQPPHPGLPPLNRLWLASRVVHRVLGVPIWGSAWFLDELLFGRRLDQRPVERPLFMLSAARSGSTQMSHYLEQDPELTAPVMLQIVFPYMWLWKLVVPTLGRLISPEALERKFNEAIPLEMRQRHEGHPLRTDTFEVLWLLSTTHVLSSMLGPETVSEDIVFMGSAPHNRRMWDEALPDFIDRLGRKTLLYADDTGTEGPTRLFIKGHFLEARDAMAQRWPDAHFLTMVRDPIKRIESVINHVHANALEEPLGAIPWTWIAQPLVRAESLYCTTEMDWYGNGNTPNRTVVRFRDYVDDLEGTMTTVYERCLGVSPLPPHVPREHTPRERKNYAVHRTLEQLHVDRAALATSLHDYRVWCGAVTPEPELLSPVGLGTEA